MKKMLFICNPRSGKERLRTKLLDILDLFVKADCEATIHVTQSAGDAKQKKRAAAQSFWYAAEGMER